MTYCMSMQHPSGNPSICNFIFKQLKKWQQKNVYRCQISAHNLKLSSKLTTSYFKVCPFNLMDGSY